MYFSHNTSSLGDGLRDFSDLLVGSKSNGIYLIVFQIVIGVLGTLGNIGVLLIMSYKEIAQVSYSVYFKCMAIADVIILNTNIFITITNLDHQARIEFIAGSLVRCGLMRFLTFVPRIFSPWILVLISLDRFVAIVKPLQRAIYCRVAVARWACLIVIVISSIITIISAFFTKVSEDECAVDDIGMRYDMIVYSILGSCIPCLLTSVLNFIIINKIRETVEFRKHFGNLSEENLFKLKKTTTVLILIVFFDFITMVPNDVVLNIVNIPTNWEPCELEIYNDTVINFQLGPDNLYVCDESSVKVSSTVNHVLGTLWYVHFAQHFYILFASHAHYRFAFKQTLKNIFKRA